MFYFQQLLQQGLGGIDATAMISTIIRVAYSILLVGFLIGVYQAAMRGGDLQALVVAAVKYLVVAVILANWNTAFHEVNDSFNQVAQFINSSSGAGDMFLSWFDQLRQQFAANGAASILPAINATFASILTAFIVLAAYVIYAIAVVVFAFFYVLYGCLLYVFGPLILALLPILGPGQLAKSYAVNLMVWNSWGILYATFGSLITALQFNRVEQVISEGFLGGFFQGTSDSLILGLISIVYSLALLLIPFIAKRLISGDVGSSAYSLVRAGAAGIGAVTAGISGFAAGVASSGETALTSAAGVASSGTASASAVTSSSAPPPQPGLAETIRSGIMSAVGGIAPASPSSSADSDDQSGDSIASGAGAPAGSGRREMPVPAFRPTSVTQTFAFHTGKLAGAMASGNGRPHSNRRNA